MSRITIYGTSWCIECDMAKKFFAEHDIDYEYIDINRDIEARKKVEEITDGHHSVPTIVFLDGSALVEPSGRQLAEKLGIQR